MAAVLLVVAWLTSLSYNALHFPSSRGLREGRALYYVIMIMIHYADAVVTGYSGAGTPVLSSVGAA